ncbi:MAG: O-antigen ligase family protein [Terriglobales bacterium]
MNANAQVLPPLTVDSGGELMAPVVPPPTAARLVLYLSVAGAVFGMFSKVLTLYNYEFVWLLEYPKLVNPLIAMAALAMVFQRKYRRLDPLVGVLLLMLIVGTATGVVAGPTLRFFVPHFFIIVFILANYWMGSSLDWDPRWLDQFLSRACYLVTAAGILSIGFFWIWSVLGGVAYLGVGTSALVLPWAYYLVKRNRLALVLIAMVVFASGKRGVYLALLSILLLHLSPARWSLNWKAATALLMLTVVIVGVFQMEHYIDLGALPSVPRRILNKWFLLNPFREAFNPEIGSSGRTAEIRDALKQFQRDDWNWITGQGFGWNYLRRSYFYQYSVSHYVHLSPLNFIMQHGIVLTSLFFFLVWSIVARGYRGAKQFWGHNSIQSALTLYVFGALVSGLTAYEYAINPWIWLVLGMVSGMCSRSTVELQAAFAEASPEAAPSPVLARQQRWREALLARRQARL